MIDTRTAFHILADEGQLVRIVGKPRMHESMVRVGNGVADIRYRAEFPKWSAELTIRYNAAVISAEQVVNLLQLGGFSCGIGEMRPEKTNFSHGLFHVEVNGKP